MTRFLWQLAEVRMHMRASASLPSIAAMMVIVVVVWVPAPCLWLPAALPSLSDPQTPQTEEQPLQPLSAHATGSTVSSGSRHLRPGDWRAAAAAETGGGPVQAPPADFSFAVDITPNIDDVHSPASSIFTDGAASPALNSYNGTPNALSPLRPRVLATSSVLDAAATWAGTPATQEGTPAMGKEAARGAQTAQGSPASLGGDEVSFTWQSQSAADDEDVEQPELPQPMSPQSPSAALQRIGSLGELSTPGSGGYNSPVINVTMKEQQPPESIMRSSVTHNPLFVDRPAPVMENDTVAKALSLTPCSNADDSGAARESRGDMVQPVQLPAEPPSPILPALDLETPRRSIRGLSAMFGNTGATSAGVSGHNAATSNKQQATPCSGLSQPSWGAAPAHASAAEVTPCSAPALRDSVADVKGASRPEAAAPGAPAATSPNAGSRRSSLQVDVDDTTGPRNLDQTPRKTGRSSSSKTKEADVQQAGAQAPAAPQPKQQRRASSGSMLMSAASWLAILLCAVLMAFNNPFSSLQHPERFIELNKLGPVCFPEPFPGAWLKWPAASSVAAPSSLTASPALDKPVDAVQPGLVSDVTLLTPSADIAAVESDPSPKQEVSVQLEAVTEALVLVEGEPVAEVAEPQQPSAAEAVVEEPAAEGVVSSSAHVAEEPLVVGEIAAAQQPESAQEVPAPPTASGSAEADVQPAEELLNEPIVEVAVEQAPLASVPKTAFVDVPADVPAEAESAARQATGTADAADADAQVADVVPSSADSSSSSETAMEQGPRRLLGWSLAELFIGVVLACAAGVGLALAVERYGLYPDAQREAAAAAERAVAAMQQAPKAAEAAPAAPLPLTPTARILKLRTPLRAGAPWSNERTAVASEAGSDVHERDVQRTPAGAFVWKQNRLVYVEDGLE
eukprot:XP_001695332.1 predicted protein [Chlamydomonas reinhardtii]